MAEDCATREPDRVSALLRYPRSKRGRLQHIFADQPHSHNLMRVDGDLEALCPEQR